MALVGSEHQERYDQMQKDVNQKEIEFWFHRSGETNETNTAGDLDSIISFLVKDAFKVGPIGPHFVKEQKDKFKGLFYDVPLSHTFVHDEVDNFEALAFVATNSENSVMMKGCFDFLRYPGNDYAFTKLNLGCICIQRATANNGQSIVVGVDCISELKPMAFYEHPANGRVLMAMNGEEVPDRSAFLVYGKRVAPKVHVSTLYMESTNLYNDFEIGNIEKSELSMKLYSFFKAKDE